MLSAAQRSLVDELLGNEMDMAFRRRASWMLDRLELRDGLDVLDLGCGPGWYVWALSRLGGLHVVALDSDAGRLAALGERGTGATLVHGDAQALPFPDASFDRVLMTEVLEHLPDDDAALREIRRVLRPGGLLVMSVPHARYPLLWDPISRAWARLGRAPIRRGPVVGIWTGHERLYTAAELRERVDAAGLQIGEVVESTHACVPFAHFIVYGLGKPLLEHGLLSRRMADRADRFAAERNDRRAADPINLARRLLLRVDARNDRPRARQPRTFVNVLLTARR